jgi:putative transposase
VAKPCAWAVLPITFTLSRRCRERFPMPQLIEGIKKPSSKWIKALEARYRGFFWQRGYGAFSVSPSQLDTALKYLETQQEHHRTRTFQEEYRQLLRRHGVEFDERYVWD